MKGKRPIGHLKRLAQELNFSDEVHIPVRLPDFVSKFPFWCNHFLDGQGNPIPDGSECCFNHFVGLPTRWNQRHPIYDFQKELIVRTVLNRYIWILKAAKIGVTELYLRWIIFKCISDPDWKNGQVAIIVGTNSTEADDMLLRIKNIIRDQEGNYKIPVLGYDNRHEIFINSVHIKAHPADNIDAVRSKPNMKLILVDEMSFFRMVEQTVVRDALEHYIGGSSTYIVLVSTAGKTPQGVMYDIQEDANAVYDKNFLYYTKGLEPHKESKTTLYKLENIELLRDQASFARNYELSWISGEGNIFDSQAVDQCVSDFNPYSLIGQSETLMLIDPAYGSSNYGIVIMTRINGVIWVLYAKEYERPSTSAMFDEVWRLYQEFKVTKVIVDGHYTGEIKSLQEGSSDGSRKPMYCSGKTFNNESKSRMKSSAVKAVMEKTVRIHKTMKILIGQLKAAVTDSKGNVDKKVMNFDVGDCFLMGCDEFAYSAIGIRKMKSDD